jgi:hypothetical protein
MARTILIHYHLFKNAGTSLDAVLKENFGDKWITREFDRKNAAIHAREVKEWIASNPNAVAFSSHTIEAPPPHIDGVRVIPLIFLRNPIDRIASAYSFERKQGGQGFGAVLARNTTMQGYIEVRLAMERDRQCRNFQIARFSKLVDEKAGGNEQERAAVALAALPFIGIVEDFGGSMLRLASLIKTEFPNFAPKAIAVNVSKERNGQSIEQRLDAVRVAVGDATYKLLLAANAEDIAFYGLGLQYAQK